MANNNAFINPFLDIQYDLSQNLVINEDELSDHENVIRDRAIGLWKNHLAEKIFQFNAENDVIEIFCSNYKFQDWFREGQVDIIRSFADIGISADDWEPLKLKIPKIGNEIFKFTAILTKLKCHMSKQMLLEFLNGLCITPHGTVNCSETATFLIDNTNLKIKYKYALACYFCLKPKILLFHQEFLTEFGHRFIFNEEDRLMVFWTYHLDDKDAIFNDKVRHRLSYDERNNEHLLNWAIRNENETAFYYVWENFSDDEIKNNLITFIRTSLEHGSINIICYLISQINYEDVLQALCKNASHTILFKLQYHSRWGTYYKRAADYVHGLVNEMRFIYAIKTLIVFWFGKESDEEEPYRILVNDLGERCQVDINVNYLFNNNSEPQSLLMVLLYLDDEDTIKDLLYIGNLDELKLILEGPVIIEMGTTLLDNDKQDVYETFLREILEGNEIEAFKRKFYAITGNTLFEET